jgi:hypothetical protein
VRISRVLDGLIGFIAPYTITQIRTSNYSAIAILRTFQFTVAHALGFSAFTSHILATDLSQSHCNFKSRVKTSCHSLIPVLPFLQLPFPKTRLDSRLLFYTPCYSASTPTVLPNTSYYPFARNPRKTPSSVVQNARLLVHYLARDVLLLSACVAGLCLPTRCLAVDVHITISCAV